jgi:hypothetical protein
MRDDAYMKAGSRAEALADYRRVTWSGAEPSLPRNLCFSESRGTRFCVARAVATATADDVSKMQSSGVRDGFS